MWGLNQNRRQKFLNRGLYICAEGLTFWKFDKISTDLWCFIICKIGRVEPTIAPRGASTGLNFPYTFIIEIIIKNTIIESSKTEQSLENN